MAVTEDRKFTKKFVYNLLEGVKGKTLGEVDKSHQFDRTLNNSKITGIAGDVVEQSVFGYARDSKQECDIEIDGQLYELKTTGVRVKKEDLSKVNGKIGAAYDIYLGAKEGISITAVTFEPTIQTDFETSHFWDKAEHLLIVFYEYKSYDVVPASAYAQFHIVDYCFNKFSENEKSQLRNDWELVSSYLTTIYGEFHTQEKRYENLEGFTHKLRPSLLLIELVPGFKKRASGSYQKPRYRLKQTFVDYLVRGHFNKTRDEVNLKESFSSFAELDYRCHKLAIEYKGKTLGEMKKLFGLKAESMKQLTAECVLRMFGTDCKKLNQIADFNKAGIIAKTITLSRTDGRTEDMKLQHVDFDEWRDRDLDFEDSVVYNYFTEHSFLCPVFKENADLTNRKARESKEDYERRIQEGTLLTTFEGFKRLAFNDAFINDEVKRTWDDSRALIHRNELVWEYDYDKEGNKIRNASGSYKGAPNLPKSAEYNVFFRGGANDSREEARTESVNGVKMLPQYFWIKGSYIVDKLNEVAYL